MNPMLWLHTQISGGYRNLGFVCGGFALLVFGIYWVVASAEAAANANARPGMGGPTMELIWLILLSAAQAAFLLMMAPGAIRKAVARDFQSGMVESNRISPMSSLRIIVGYMSGPPIVALALYATSVLCALWFLTQVKGGMSTGAIMPATIKYLFGGWAGAQVLLLLLSFMFAAATLLMGLGTSGKHNLVGTVVVIFAVASWVVFPLVPGVALLVGVMSGIEVMGLVSRGTAVDEAIPVIGALLNLIFGVLFLWTASRRVRNSDRALFSPIQALCFSVMTAVTLALGVIFADQLRDRFFEDARFEADMRVIASAVMMLLIGLIVCHSCGSEALRLDRAAALGQPGRARRWLSLGPLVHVLLLVAMIAASTNWLGATTASENFRAQFLSQPAVGVRALALVAVSCFSATYLCYALYYWMSASGVKLWITTLVIVAIFAIPVGLDGFFAYAASESRLHWPGERYLSGISPIGTFVLQSRGAATPAYVGVGVQIALTLLALLMMRRSQARVAIPAARKM